MWLYTTIKCGTTLGEPGGLYNMKFGKVKFSQKIY